MKRIILLLCLCLSLILPLEAMAAPQWPADISIESEAGILMDADTGTILYGKNIDQPYYPASITKILTALIVLEHCDLDEMVEFSHDDVYNVEEGSSSAGIDEGDILTVRDCLYALMLASANESANALACHVSGSREEFAELMNETAARLGCTGSHFANPSGLNDENHYTTAHDMALIIQEAIKNPEYLKINGARNYQLAPTKRTPEGGYVANHHKMLMKHDPLYYPGAFAGKTGYTSIAGNTLVTCAERNGMRLITVVLGSHLTHYPDTKALMDFGFSNFQSLKASDYETNYKSLENDMTIAGMTAQDSIALELDDKETVLIPKQASFSDLSSSLSYDLDENAPEKAIARILYTYENRPVGCVHLLYPGLTALPEQEISAQEAAALSEQEIGAPEAAAALTEQEIGAQEAAAALPQEASKANAATSSSIPSADAPETAPASRQLPAPKHISISPAAWAAIALFLLAAIVVGWKLYSRRREKEDLLLRRQRRLDRLEDMGFSASDFDRLVAQRRSTSFSTNTSSSKNRRRRKRKKSIFH